MNQSKEKFLTIKKANELLIAKIDELNNYLESASFNMGEKELNKYYNLKSNEKALNYKKEYDKKANLVQTKIEFSLEKLEKDKVSLFVKDLVNYYAKVEDGYFEVLSISKNQTLNAVSLFKCEVSLDYYKNNLEFINNLEEKFITKLNNLNELTA